MNEEDLQLHLALSNHNLGENKHNFTTIKKRTFRQSFSDDDMNCRSNKRTWPLLIWEDNHNLAAKVNEEILTRESAITHIGFDVEEEVVVGWPPVKSSMRKLTGHHRRESTAANYITVENGGGGGRGGSINSKYVKVEMEGIGIARKIDLGIHYCYEILTATLIDMFGKRPENLKMYRLTYQDKEGDWLLAGDVPWPSFVGTVRRLKLVRKDW